MTLKPGNLPRPNTESPRGKGSQVTAVPPPRLTLMHSPLCTVRWSVHSALHQVNTTEESNPKERVGLGLNEELTRLSAVRTTVSLSLNQAGAEPVISIHCPSLVGPEPERWLSAPLHTAVFQEWIRIAFSWMSSLQLPQVSPDSISASQRRAEIKQGRAYMHRQPHIAMLEYLQYGCATY